MTPRILSLATAKAELPSTELRVEGGASWYLLSVSDLICSSP